MNVCFIIGNLTKDPDARQTSSGIPVSNLTVAVQRDYKDSSGERKADFIQVVAYRQTAEFCNKFLTKGRKVAVEGSIQVRKYNAQDGSTRYVTELIANRVEALGSPQKQQQEQKEELDFAEVDVTDDLPFA